jgi:drug/metabolite transporter (DMT)-like permease
MESVLTKSTVKPFFELVTAGAFWGFGFVATIWCFKALAIPAILFYRFAGASIVGFAWLFFKKTEKATLKHEMALALIPSFFLALTLLLQTYGLAGTNATKSAFITTTYVVFVPLISSTLGWEKIRWIHWIWVALACVGGALTLDTGWSEWHAAEILTGLNALAASGHILAVGRIARTSKNSLAFNTWQALFVALLCLPFAAFQWGVSNGGAASQSWNLLALNNIQWVGILSLTLGSSFLAFLLQIRAQKKLKASMASLLFLLESPFSFLFAFLLLGESMGPLQTLGAGLILLSCVCTIVTEGRLT